MDWKRLAHTAREKVFGSQTQTKPNIEAEILAIQAELAKFEAIAAMKQSRGWEIIRTDLLKNIEESAQSVIGYSIDPVKNMNFIISEGAKRERDLALIQLVDASPQAELLLKRKLEVLNQTIQREASQETTYSFGPDRRN